MTVEGRTYRSMKYTPALLEEILSKGGARALEKYPIYNQRLRVKFRCECGRETSKRFEMLQVHRLPYCEECSLKKKEERKQTSLLTNYGVSNIGSLESVKCKINKTFQEKFGGHPKQNKEVQDKWKATCLEKYGGHPNQNKEVQLKSEATSFAFKDYMMPSGTVVKYQGYENVALDELVQLYEEENISIGRSSVPSVA